MPVSSTHEICPYTLKRLSDLKEVNDEHIFPDAIGGVKDYMVRVSAEANSRLGRTLDSALVDSFVILGKRMDYRIKSRSGLPKMTLSGDIPAVGTKVEVTFHTDEKPSQYVRNPVQMDPSGESGLIIQSADKLDAFWKKFVSDNAKKGKEVFIEADESLGNPAIQCKLKYHHQMIVRAMFKIAYVAIYEFIGDAFLSDPKINEWLKILFSEDQAEVDGIAIYNAESDEIDKYGFMLPDLQPWEHAVSIANLDGKSIYVAVSLFGVSSFTHFFIASEASTYGLDLLDGIVVICDSQAGITTKKSFREHLHSIAYRVPFIQKEE